MRACAFCRGHFQTGAVSSKMQTNTGTCTLFRLHLGKKMQKKLLNLFCISFFASAPTRDGTASGITSCSFRGTGADRGRG